MSYIIDFERLNELTTVVDGDMFPKGNTVSRNILKEYMDAYVHRSNNVSRRPEYIEHVIETLVYNRILIGPAEIRDKKIESVLS